MHREYVGPSLLLNRAGQFLSEYLLAIYPGREVSEKITLEKKLFGLAFGQKVDSHQPFIPLASFVAKEMMEDTILRWVQRICDLQRSFEVKLQHFSGHPPHTIYLQVEDHQPFRMLTNQLKMVDQFIQSNDCPPAILYHTPYLSVADQLPEAVYQEALPLYALRTFSESFAVQTLVLQKRSDAYEKWQPVNQFTLPPPSY